MKGKRKRDSSQEDNHEHHGIGQLSWKYPEKKVNNEVKPNGFHMDHVKMDTGARMLTHPYSSKVTTRCCYSCEEDGHLSRDCPNKKPRPLTNVIEYHGQEYEDMMAKILPMKSKKDRGDVTSFHLANGGHSASGSLWSNLQSNLPNRDIR